MLIAALIVSAIGLAYAASFYLDGRRPEGVPAGAVYNGAWPTDGQWVHCEGGEGALLRCRIYFKDGRPRSEGLFVHVESDALSPEVRMLAINIVDGHLAPYRHTTTGAAYLVAQYMSEACAQRLLGSTDTDPGAATSEAAWVYENFPEWFAARPTTYSLSSEGDNFLGSFRVADDCVVSAFAPPSSRGP